MRWELKIKSCNYGGSLTSQIFRGVKRTIFRGDCLKNGAWKVCRFKGGLGGKERGGVFEGCWYYNVHYVKWKKNVWCASRGIWNTM